MWLRSKLIANIQALTILLSAMGGVGPSPPVLLWDLGPGTRPFEQQVWRGVVRDATLVRLSPCLS